MARELDLSPDLVWTGPGPHAPDFGGPVGVAFEPVVGGWHDRHPIERIDAMARRHPDKVAVDDGSLRIPYGVLERSIDDLAARIDDVVPPGRTVVAVVHTTAGYAAPVLASLATGRTLAIIDAANPPERQAMVLAAAAPAAVILSSDRLADDRFIPADVPRIVTDPTNPGPRPRPALQSFTGPQGIVFTSGSTGKAKGLAIGGEATMSLMTTWMDAAHLNENDVALVVGSPALGGRTDLIQMLMAGGTARILDLRATGLAEAFRQLAAERITVLSFVPTALRSIFRVPGAAEAFRSLRLLGLYGESTLASDIALFRANLPKDCVISITLGSTEALVMTQWFVRDEAITGPVVPVGYVVPYKEIALVGDDGRNVPVGEVGELVVRGRHMMMGGWEDGHLTPPPSVEDPAEPGRRIYATGDFARMREDGLLEYAGRRDQQVKIRGLKADLGVVEATIRAHPGIVDVATVLLSPEAKLVAFVTVQPNVPSGGLPLAIRDALAKVLPPHMVPAQVDVLDAIPWLHNHKPDRVRLMAMARGEADPAGAPERP